MDVLTAEGIGYFEDHLKELGGYVYEYAHGYIYAIHTDKIWKDCIEQIIDNIPCRWHLFGKPELLKTTKMKNGQNNYVFQMFLG